MVFVDVEDVVVSFLGGRPGFAGIVVDAAPPPDFDGGRCVVVPRYGGFVVADDGLDHAIVRFDAYGPHKAAAHAVANTARAAVTLLSQVEGPGNLVERAVDETRGPYRSPDRNHGMASCLARHRLVGSAA